MMKPEIEEDKIVIFTGAGISAESGLRTFRDTDGLWNQYRIEDVATPSAWENNPELVLEFYNERRKLAFAAKPNKAHMAVASLEEKYNVIVITQNVDDLHERAGSSNVIHVHGQLKLARSSINEKMTYDLGEKPISMGDTCEKGSQLRPNVVWFGENIQNYEVSRDHLITANRVLVVGTSLSVFPAAGILKKARNRAEKVIVSREIKTKPFGFNWMRGKATVLVPIIVGHWLNGRKAI